MRRSLLALLMVLAAPANAWDGFKMFEDPTRGPTSGGGGIWGTGAKRDHAITCASCHTKALAKINALFTFTPVLQANNAYKPGQRYQVTVKLQNEWLGRNFMTCDQYVMSMNGFAATFENAAGQRTGRLESDSGQDSNACPATIAGTPTGTTVTYGTCDVVASTNAEDQTQWTFFWTAPAAGSGAVKMFWGVVDGNCDMKSLGDDVKVGNLSMPQGT